MNQSLRGKNRAGRLLLTLILSSVVPALLAQTDAPAAPETESTAPAEPAASAAEDLDIEADATPPQPSPDDYQASEQISEDLSVSFPVDI